MSPKAARKRELQTPIPSPARHLSLVSEPAICHEPACDNIPVAAGFCRLHYIKNWSRIKQKETILKEGNLQRYIEDLTRRLSDKQIAMIHDDLASDDTFLSALEDIELFGSTEYPDTDTDEVDPDVEEAIKDAEKEEKGE